MHTFEGLLQMLDPAAEPRLVFARRAPQGLGSQAGTLLCLDASFNPLTVAHVALVTQGAGIIPPDEVLLLLAKTNVDKEIEGFPLARRIEMLCRFAESRPAVSVAAVSHARFVDKATAIRPHYRSGTRLVFLLGYDTLLRLFDPRYYADPAAGLATLFARAEVIVAHRPPAPPGAVRAFLARPDIRPYAARIHSVGLPEAVATVSASRVRTCLTRGESVVGLVPPEIFPLLGAGY